MSLRTKLSRNVREGIVGGAITVIAGLCLGLLPLGEGLVHMSYDLPFVFGSQVVSNQLVIIKMDEVSYREMNQAWGTWDHTNHTLLLHQLKAAKCNMVVFDVMLADPGPEQTDKDLARAIAAHGRVVLAVDRVPLDNPGMIGERTLTLRGPFRSATPHWGIARVERDTDQTLRLHYAGTEFDPSLPWAAAVLAKAPVTATPANRRALRWLRYYGPDGTLPSLSYYQALAQTNNFFEDKIVFIGGKPRTLFVGQETDIFRTPYTRWTGEGISGVEIEATMFLNLLRGDWLTRLSAAKEFFLIIFCGLLFGYGLVLFRPLAAIGLAVLGIVGVSLLALTLFWLEGVWFSWVVIAGVQIPCAFVWSALVTVRRLFQRLRIHEGSSVKAGAGVSAPRPADGAWPAARKIEDGEKTLVVPQPSDASAFSVPAVTQPEEEAALTPIPDHVLLRCVGEGAYGKVWLARDAIGTYHAVKILYRARFSKAGPYEREFKGIQKFTPISRSHPGFVHVLHVGRNDRAGYFYYMMELGDDETSGQNIDPKTYSAKTLAKELMRRGKMPIEECLRLGLALTAALDYLHQQQLIHRDIKPSNIIFVRGEPKFADIGLVTDIGRKSGDASYYGTEGYIAPEGPGTPSADVYSLGKVMYELSMGRDRLKFPELPSTLTARSDVPGLLRLNAIILRACETDVSKRYQSASEMHADLLGLQALVASPPQR